MDAGERDNDWWVRELGGGPGAAEAQGELRRVLVVGLRRVLAARKASTDLADDLAQEALLRVRERLDTFRGQSRFTTWALSIATRLLFDELRHHRWRDVSIESAAASARAGAPEPLAEASQERTLLRERVLAALRDVIEGQLTERQRAALEAELAGMPQAEIALQLGMNRNALYKLSHDARRKVKARLEAAGISAADVLWAFE